MMPPASGGYTLGSIREQKTTSDPHIRAGRERTNSIVGQVAYGDMNNAVYKTVAMESSLCVQIRLTVSIYLV